MILRYKSDNKISPFAPEWDMLFYMKNLSDKNTISEMRNYILNIENDIIKEFPDVNNDGGTGLGPNSLTSKFSKFNIFSWKESPFVKFQNFVKEEHSKFIDELNLPQSNLWIGCWANVIRHGQFITPHWHNSNKHTYLGAHLCLTDSPHTSTVYVNPFKPNILFNNLSIESSPPNSFFEFHNNEGDLLFFPNWMIHFTTPYLGDDVRITLAMDIILDKEYQENKNEKIIQNYVKFN